jgi:multiple sugar transport system permease protein
VAPVGSDLNDLARKAPNGASNRIRHRKRAHWVLLHFFVLPRGAGAASGTLDNACARRLCDFRPGQGNGPGQPNKETWPAVWADRHAGDDRACRPFPSNRLPGIIQRDLVKFPIGQSYRGAQMSGMQQVLAAGGPVAGIRPPRPTRHSHLHGSDFAWAIAFVVPYAAVFFAFAVYPICYALWMASDPSLYVDLAEDPFYLPAVVNTLLFVGLGVNVKMFLALLLSGFFMRRHWWIKALLVIYVLPWALAAVQAFISFHWMLIGEQGLIDRVLSVLFGIDGPLWFNHRWLGLGADIVSYIWKWMPFWTLIFLAGRMAIPQEIYDAAAVDGATGSRRFVHVTFPILANLFLVCTLLSTLWTIGDFTTVYFVSGGGPALSTEVLATLGFHYAFDAGKPALGVAAMMSALPVLIPIAITLMRKLQTREVQL